MRVPSSSAWTAVALLALLVVACVAHGAPTLSSNEPIGDSDTLVVSASTREVQDALDVSDGETINLTGIPIGDASMELVIAALSPKLRTLKMTSSRLTTATFRKLLDQIQKAPELRELDIGDNWLTDGAAKDLGYTLHYIPKLEKLNVGYNFISNDGLRWLLDKMADAPELRSFACKGGWDIKLDQDAGRVIGERLKNMPKLEVLDLEKQPLKTVGLQNIFANLESVPNLRELRIPKTDMTFPAAKALGPLLKSVPQLEVLDLAENKNAKDKGFRAIFSHLSHVPNLRELNVYDCEIETDGMLTLVENLKYLPKLEVLNLSKNSMREKLAEPFAHALKYIPQLRILRLGTHKFGVEGAVEVGKHLSKLTKLEELSFSGDGFYFPIYGQGTGQVLKSVAKIKSLRVLDISNTKPDAYGLGILDDVLPSMLNLEELYIGANSFEEEHGKQLASIISRRSPPKLRRVWFEGNPLKTDTNLEIINAQVKTFGPLFTKIDIGGWMLDDDKLKGSRLLQYLQGAPNIEWFSIGTNKLTDDGILGLADLVGGWSKLRVLDLRSNPIGDRGLQGIIKKLPPTVESLSFSNTQIGDDTLVNLANKLSSLPKLVRLDLGENKDFTEDGLKMFMKHVHHCHALKELILNNCYMSRKSARIIGDYLHTIPSLGALDLSRNLIGDNAALHVIKQATRLPFFVHLTLRGTGLTDDGAKEIADVLGSAQPYGMTLDLAENSIQDAGAWALADREVAPDAKLRKLTLNLIRNNISEEVRRQIHEAHPLIYTGS